MRKAIKAIFLLAIVVSFSGCFITARTNRGHGHHKSKRCHSNQYWDGHKCKHKKHKHKHKKKKKHDHRKHDKKKHDHRKHDKKKEKHDHRDD